MTTSPAVTDAVNEVILPNDAYKEHWDSVVVEPEVKTALVNHTALALQLRPKFGFEESAVHGLIVVTGPPGTGKTTLARGLPQKLTEVMRGKIRLIEVNPNGLMSAEHGQSQQLVDELLLEYLPELAADSMPTIALLDEVESMAVARSESSLSANPVDVHRATDAVLMAIDKLASTAPHMVFVATSNFVKNLDEAFLSRADATIWVPRPSVEALRRILSDTLKTYGREYPGIAKLAENGKIGAIAKQCDGLDGRQMRKLVPRALARSAETAFDPSQLTVKDLAAQAADVKRELAEEKEKVVRGAA